MNQSQNRNSTQVNNPQQTQQIQQNQINSMRSQIPTNNQTQQ